MRILNLLPCMLVAALMASPAAGSDEPIENRDLARAVEQTVAAETAYVAVDVAMEAPAAGIELTSITELEGQVTFGEELRGWLKGSLMESGTISFIAEGSHFYLSGDVVEDMLPPGAWLLVDAATAPPGFGELQGMVEVGSDAALALYWLLGASGPADVLGMELLDGIETTHIAVPIDLKLARDHVPDWLLEPYEQNVAGLREANADVDRAEAWLGDDGFVRRITYEMPIALRDELAVLSVAYDLSQFGEPIELDVPDPTDVVDAWDLVATD